MTATLIAADRMEEYAIDTQVNTIPRWDDNTDGVYGVRRACRVRNADGSLYCTRPAGHNPLWNHIATNGIRILARWGAQSPPEPDPAGELTEGQTVGDNLDTLYVPDVGLQCRANRTDGEIGHCTRPAGHFASWPHVDVRDGVVVALWGQANWWREDPLARATAGYTGDYPGWDNRQYGLRAAPYCQYHKPGESDRSFCTRPQNHPGRHVATNLNERILWTDDVDLVAANAEVLPYPAADGSPLDDTAAVFTAPPSVGEVVKLRDRDVRLYVLAEGRDNQVQVLDMEDLTEISQPIDLLVKVSDNTLTEPELAQVVQWYAGHRKLVRQVAVREYRGGRWCMDGLNQNLRRLGLPEYEPSLSGYVEIRVPFSHADVHATASVVEKLVNDALTAKGVLNKLMRGIPQIEGIELEPESMTLRASEMARR